MERWAQCFGKGLPKVIGMIHVPALPGTPRNKLPIKDIVKKVLLETDIYGRAGVDGILVENMHDLPYVHPSAMGPEVTAAMTRVCSEVRKILPATVPCGVQVLAAGNEEALAVAQSAELQFIRCEGFVFSHVADEGWTNSCAARLMRYRKNIQAENILVFTDVKKKHSSHAVTGDISIEETAAAAEFFLSDGVVVTGSGTGHEANIKEVAQVRERVQIPILIGSGVTVQNISAFSKAEGLIIGSYFKKHGSWDQNLEEEKVIKLMQEVKTIREATIS